MKKYFILMFCVVYSFCAPETANIKTQILLSQLESALKQLLGKVQKIITKPASTGTLLGDIAQGIALKKTPKPEEKPKPVEIGGLPSAFGESDLIKKAKGLLKEQGAVEGASEEEWAESEKTKPSPVPTVPQKTAEQPKFPKNIFGTSVPELIFSSKGSATEISSAIANYVTLLDVYLEDKINNKLEIPQEIKDRIKQGEENIDDLVDDKYSKTQKLQFHAKMQELRNKYKSLGLKPYAPKPLTPKPTIPAKPVIEPVKAPVAPGSEKPVPTSIGLPKKTFSPSIGGGGDLLSQIAASEKSKLKGVDNKSGKSISSIDFSKMAANAVVDTLYNFKNDIDKISLKQLVDIASNGNSEELFDVLSDSDVWDDLKRVARTKVAEADVNQRVILNRKYGIKI